MLTRLLCTVVANTIQSTHPFGSIDITSRRYCSTHWFFRSDSPSVWGWNAVDRFCSIVSFWANAFPKWEVKRGSLSLITLVGSPNHRYTLSRYNWAIPGPVIVVLQGRKIAPREHPWSTIVRMASFPWHIGNPVIRSIAILWKGSVFGVVGMRNKGVFVLWVWILFCWHVAHPLTYSAIQAFMPFQVVCAFALRIVSSRPGCPAVGWSWTRNIMALF